MFYSSKTMWLIMSVVVVLLPATDGQAYHFVIGHHQRNYDQLYWQPNTRTTQSADENYTDTSAVDLENSNSTIIVTTVRESNDFSQTAMDIITIVWYIATFLALAAFFLLMACSDRRCTDTQRNAPIIANEAPISPPTPSPSYSQFAPPSYDSVMKMHRASKTSIYVVPFSMNQTTAKDTNNSLSPNVNSTAPSINFYTINELQKLAT